MTLEELEMSARRSYVHLLPFIGAAVVTAGAAFLHITRRPATEQDLPRPTARVGMRPEGSQAHAGVGAPAQAASEYDSLVSRLRERGL